MPSPPLIVFKAFTSVHQSGLLCNCNIAVCHFQDAYVFQKDPSQRDKHSKQDHIYLMYTVLEAHEVQGCNVKQ